MSLSPGFVPVSIATKTRNIPARAGSLTTKVRVGKHLNQRDIIRDRIKMIYILHISDLNLSSESDSRKYSLQLQTDLSEELRIKKLDYLVITGDIASNSIPEEYDAAVKLIDDLSERFGLDAERIIVVPGIQDINLDLSENAYPFIPKRKLPDTLPEGKWIPGGDLGILVRDEDLYKHRFLNFSKHFYKPLYGFEYPTEYEDQAVLFENSNDGILFLALNSCWEIDHYYVDRSGVHIPALTNALRKITGRDDKEYLKIAVCHHPVSGPLMMKKVDFMELLTVQGFKILLHGHIHEALQGFYHYDERRGIHMIGAGALGASAKDRVPGIPFQYNLIVYDKEAQRMTVETRRKEKSDGAWAADARWGNKNDPQPRYVIDLHPKGKKPFVFPEDIGAEELQVNLKMPDKYKKWIIDHCQYMDIENLKEGSHVIQISLPEIFIPLYTYPPAETSEKDLDVDRMGEHQERLSDIEDLIFENDSLLIEGLAGSGKTTLFKHFSLELVKQGNWKGLNGWLPVLIFLRDLKGFEESIEDRHADATIAERILSYYFKSKENIIDVNVIKGFCRAKRAVFLLDGLGEIESNMRKKVINAFADFRISNPGIKMVLSGRPHGIDSAVSNRFGKKHVRILPFDMKQVESFIEKWFRFVYRSDSGIGKNTAQEMISEIKVHPAVDKLIGTPLMLTAICILYHDKKKLPDQRARNYTKDSLITSFPGDFLKIIKQSINS